MTIAQEGYPTHTSKFPELGFYAFPGATQDTQTELEQVKFAEQLGIGSVMISERTDYKEAGALCGAIAAVTEKICIHTSATNPNTRHPVFLAAMCSTINRLSNGRFALGLGKGNGLAMTFWGLQPVTFDRERDYLDLIKRLLRGETLKDYSGEIGDYPRLSLGSHVNEDVPILFVGFGPNSLKNAGSLYDGAHLHTFMPPHSVSRAVQLFREGEDKAGKEASRGRVWSVLATVCNASAETYLKYIVARLATYLQIPGYGEGLAKINGWDLEELTRFRQQPAVRSVNGLIDTVATLPQLEAIDKVVPEDWRSAALGSPAECARRWVEEFEAGADGVIIHASRPEEFEPVLTEYEKIRPHSLFEGRTNRPA